LGPIGLGALVVLVLTGDVAPDHAVFSVAAILVALLLAFVSRESWEKLAARLEKAEILGIGLGLRPSQQAEAQVLPEEQDRRIEEVDGSAAERWLALRLNLEAKLAYIAKTMRPGEEKSGAPRPQNFVTVGSLEYDGYLTRAEAETATAVLAPGLVAVADQKLVLERATKVVGGIRASVFFNMVRNRVSELVDSVEEIPRGERRPDLLAKRGNREYRVASAFATHGGSKILADVRKRLQSDSEDPAERIKVVVIPDNSRSLPDDAEQSPRVVKLGELPQALQ
jgi:hypothetical protein